MQNGSGTSQGRTLQIQPPGTNVGFKLCYKSTRNALNEDLTPTTKKSKNCTWPQITSN
jgi:hypothetical protein